jgi:hypothetical protein
MPVDKCARQGSFAQVAAGINRHLVLLHALLPGKEEQRKQSGSEGAGEKTRGLN